MQRRYQAAVDKGFRGTYSKWIARTFGGSEVYTGGELNPLLVTMMRAN